MNINKILKEYANNEYKNFNQKICHTNYELLGVPIPILKKICKSLLKEYDYLDILNNLDYSIFEHIMLEGLIISYINVPLKKRFKLIDKYIPKIDNWALCDIFCSNLKDVLNNKEEYLKYIEKYLKSNKEYFIRFGIVILLNYYVDNDYLDYVLSKMAEIKSEYYYVKMAISWCLSICLVKNFLKTQNFLNNNKNSFDKWTYNKALQKGVESYRICQENKNILKSMKRDY